MAAAALPAARQITRPFGAACRCAASTLSGCAAATAASKIARSRGRLSVIASPDLIASTCAAGYPSLCRKRKPPQRNAGAHEWGDGSVPAANVAFRGRVAKVSTADVGGDDVAKPLPGLALQ